MLLLNCLFSVFTAQQIHNQNDTLFISQKKSKIADMVY